MRVRLVLLPVLLAIMSGTAFPLPVAVKNIAEVHIEGYVVFFTVGRDKLLAEGIDLASTCAVDPTGEYLPIWVPPETSTREAWQST